MLWLAILLLVAGLLGRGLGKRGRRIDLHLVCRACGFDLFNRPETSVRCPECGADTRPRWSMNSDVLVTWSARAHNIFPSLDDNSGVSP